MSTFDEKQKAIRWLQVGFGYGALVDLLAVIQMIFPSLFRLTMPAIEIDDGLILVQLRIR